MFNDAPANDAHAKPLIVIISNRGPFSFKPNAARDGFDIKRGAGGLVTALTSVAQRYEVLWVAAALSKGDALWVENQTDDAPMIDKIRLRLLIPERSRYEGYYNIIANPLLWFIQHQLWDIPRKPSITREVWEAWREGYVVINRQFADTVVDTLQAMDIGQRPVIIMPQDYHLYLMPRFLRERLGDQVQIQPFIHIPWPGPDAWRILPDEMRITLFSSLMQANRVGFQTQKDSFNFVQTCRFYVPDAHSFGSRVFVEQHGHRVDAKAYPISIDVEQVEALAQQDETRLLKTQTQDAIGDCRLILRTDRVEPSKNVLRGLEAFRRLLEYHPEHRGRVQMLALLVPSRMEVDEYSHYLRDIMAEAGLINAKFSDETWEPVRIIVGNNYARAVAAMQLYDVLLVNPIADGMNLVAKEGVLVNERDGVLILSEAAGVHYELGEHALTVSPFDMFSTVEALHHALLMPADERRQRAAALREKVRANDVKDWFNAQVEDALRAFSSQPRNASTSATPEASISADSRNESADSSDSTPTPSA